MGPWSQCLSLRTLTAKDGESPRELQCTGECQCGEHTGIRMPLGGVSLPDTLGTHHCKENLIDFRFFFRKIYYIPIPRFGRLICLFFLLVLPC